MVRPSGRVLAGLVALGVFVTLGFALAVTLEARGLGPWDGLWQMYRGYGVVTVTLLGIVLAMVAMGAAPAPQFQAGLVVWILGGVLADALGIERLIPGSGAVVHEMLYRVIPALFAIYWIVFAPKDGLRYRAVLLWLLYPLIYCGYVLFRAELDGLYPYRALSLVEEGAISVVFNIVALLALVWLGGLAVVALGRALHHLGRAVGSD